jgi:hypothetical protein
MSIPLAQPLFHASWLAWDDASLAVDRVSTVAPGGYCRITVKGLLANGEHLAGRPRPARLWAGVDVGAGKGFDVAVIDVEGLVASPKRMAAASEVVSYLAELCPAVVAVDSPIRPAPPGRLSRDGERELVKAGVCGIRYTPDMESLRGNEAYYGWISTARGSTRPLAARRSWGRPPWSSASRPRAGRASGAREASGLGRDGRAQCCRGRGWRACPPG